MKVILYRSNGRVDVRDDVRAVRAAESWENRDDVHLETADHAEELVGDVLRIEIYL